MSEYTPTMENIRDCYARYGNETTRTAEFYRAIAAHDEALEKALREQIAWEIVAYVDDDGTDEWFAAIDLAARIARGEGSE